MSRVIRDQDFDGERSDGAYSDSFQNDYDSQSSGSSPREKSSFGSCFSARQLNA